jgi:hypothetical protein
VLPYAPVGGSSAEIRCHPCLGAATKSRWPCLSRQREAPHAVN